MADNNSSSASGGLGFAGALTIAFIVLRLTHVIHWPWLWILSPIWISFGFVALIVAVLVLGALGATVRERRKRAKRASARRRG